MLKENLDEIDLRILRALQENGRLSNKELAAKIHLTTTPTYERHRRLEREGVIQRYTAIIDASKVSRGFSVFCNVGFKQIAQEYAEDFRRHVMDWQEVTECYNVSGDFDFLLKVCVDTMKSYREFMLYKVGVLNYVGNVQSVFVMDTLKQQYGINI